MSWERRAYLGIYDARNLIVNDEPLCCRLLAGILRRHNFANLQSADSGHAALQQVQALRPDLLLLDMQLPNLGGQEVCRQVRTQSEFVDLAILVQTATVDRNEMGDLIVAGASEFRSKPINPSKRVSRVTLHLDA